MILRIFSVCIKEKHEKMVKCIKNTSKIAEEN